MDCAMASLKHRLVSRAFDILDARRPKPSPETASEWAEKALGARTRAFWSARLEHARHVADLKRACLDVLKGDLSREEAIARLRSLAIRRELYDWTKESRVKLIVDMAVETSVNKARWEAMNADKTALKIAPALRFVRWYPRKEPRDWETRWFEAAQAVNWEGVYQNDGGKTKIALFRSPIWRELSAFDRPYPPFDYNSGMGTERVFAYELEQLGWHPRWIRKIKPTEGTKIDISGLGPAEREYLKEQLAGIGKIRGNTLVILPTEKA